jgi:uncharacterized damage-inducible protein DinB
MHNFETLVVFKSSNIVLNRNLKDITHEESLVTPQGGGNSINWILGHIIISRDDIRESIGLKRLCGDEMKIYDRLTEGLDPAKAFELSKLLEMYNSGQKELEDKLTETDLTGDKDNHKTVSFLAFHESYHTGQTGLLRRIIGKEGAIK